MLQCRISLRKVVNRHFLGALKITVCPPANTKNCSFRVNLTPTCYQSYVVPRWGQGGGGFGEGGSSGAGAGGGGGRVIEGFEGASAQIIVGSQLRVLKCGSRQKTPQGLLTKTMVFFD